MAQEIKGFAEHLSGFIRHLKLAVAVFVVIVAVGVGFAYSLPDIYKSSGLILIEEAEIPTEIMRSTITSSSTRMLTTLNEKILTITNIIDIVKKFDLYMDKRANTPLELLALNARNSIAIEIQSRESVSASGAPGLATVGFKVSFEDEDPQVAKIVADELVALYLAANTKERSEKTSQTADFLKKEVRDLEEEIAELEGGLARYKEENAEVLPSLTSLNMNMMTRIDDQIKDIDRQMTAIEQNRISIRAQLATVDPSVPTRLSDGSFALTPADQLKQLQTQLLIYQSKYSDNHPDVIAAARDIESLKKRFGLDAGAAGLDIELADARADLAIAKEKYSDQHPDVVALDSRIIGLQREIIESQQNQLEAQVDPDNPAYISLRSALDTLEAQEYSLKEEEANLRKDLAEYERRLMLTPQIEKEMAAMGRTLSSTSNRYWVMRDKQFATEMGETLEEENKGESMLLIEPPRVPLKPYKPNRGAIIVLAFLFAIVAGIGVTQLADALDKSIREAAAIISVQGVPPIVEVPYIYTEEELAHTAKMRRVALGSSPVLLVAVVLVVHFTVMPLDVLWYSLASRIGF